MRRSAEEGRPLNVDQERFRLGIFRAPVVTRHFQEFGVVIAVVQLRIEADSLTGDISSERPATLQDHVPSQGDAFRNGAADRSNDFFRRLEVFGENEGPWAVFPYNLEYPLTLIFRIGVLDHIGRRKRAELIGNIGGHQALH